MNDSKNVQADVQKPSTARSLLALLVWMGAASMGLPTAMAQSDDPDAGVPDAAVEAPAETVTAPAETAPAETPPAETTTTTTEPDGTIVTTTTPSDAAALGDGSGTSTTTTVAPDGTTISTTVPASGNPDEVAEEVQAEREPLAWRNSYFNYSINSSFCTFSRDCQLTYNPTVYTFLSLSPRWYLDPATFFSFYQAAYIEHTDDDNATYQHEFQLYDTRIALNHREALGDNFLGLVGGSLWLPTSKGSQAAQRYMRLGASVSGTWDPGVGGFNLSIQAAYVHWFAGSNVPLTHGSGVPSDTASSAPSPSGAPGGDAFSNQASSSTSEIDRISAGLTANWQPLTGFTITLQIFYFWINGAGLGNAAIPTGGGDIFVGDTSPSHFRTYTSYSIYFQYDFVPWFQGWIGFSNSTQLAQFFNDNGTLRSPVNLYDMQVSLGATVTLDSLYESVAVSGEDDGLTPEQRQRRRQGLARRSTSGGSL